MQGLVPNVPVALQPSYNEPDVPEKEKVSEKVSVGKGVGKGVRFIFLFAASRKQSPRCRFHTARAPASTAAGKSRCDATARHNVLTCPTPT